jgi:hypothetical protein
VFTRVSYKADASVHGSEAQRAAVGFLSFFNSSQRLNWGAIWSRLAKSVLARIVGLTCVFALHLASAQTVKSWNGSISTDWYNATNWIPSGVPALNDTIYFTNGGTITCSAAVTVGGQFNWVGGTLTGSPITIATNGVMSLS